MTPYVEGQVSLRCNSNWHDPVNLTPREATALLRMGVTVEVGSFPHTFNGVDFLRGIAKLRAAADFKAREG